MKARVGVLSLALIGFACDARTTEPDVADKRAEAPSAPVVFEETTATRDLATLQRELAGNESELRRLGVPLREVDGEAAGLGGIELEEKPADQPAAGGAGRVTEPLESVETKKGKRDDKAKRPSKHTSGATPSAVPGGAPSPSPSPKTSPDATVGGDLGPAPEQAKAVQAPPNTRPNEQQLRAEDRCPLICSLAENTCELAEEICSLAERHGDDTDYSAACERASDDCKQAQEACLECHG